MEPKKELNIQLNEFEGPLDLLLHLIKETKMDIQEVPMLVIVDQYLQFIRDMDTIQLDIAGEYLVMAATLLEIKSRVLLPRVEMEPMDDNEPDEENIEFALKQQLIEYQKFKNVAQLLREKEEERGQYFAKEPSDLDGLQQNVPLADGEVNLDDLLNAFRKMFEKQAKQKPVMATIEMNRISVEETMEKIVTSLQRLDDETGVSLASFVDSKASLIASFLAILELAKTRRIVFKQSTPYEPIKLFKGDRFEATDSIEISSGV